MSHSVLFTDKVIFLGQAIKGIKGFRATNFPYQSRHRDHPIIIFNRRSHCAGALESPLHYARVQCSNYGVIKSNDFKRFTDPRCLRRD